MFYWVFFKPISKHGYMDNPWCVDFNTFVGNVNVNINKSYWLFFALFSFMKRRNSVNNVNNSANLVNEKFTHQ